MTMAEHRYVCRLIDLAVERCEDGNLHEQLAVPRWIADLIVHLQTTAREPLAVPQDTVMAHGQLLDLRQRYMPRSSAAEASELPQRRLCTRCQQPVSPLFRRAVYRKCRRLERLVARIAEALAS